MAHANANLLFLSRRINQNLFQGVELKDLHYADSQDLQIPSIVLGGYRKGGWLTEPTGSKIPVDPSMKDLPDIGNNGRARTGSIIEMDYVRKDGTTGKRKTLVGLREENVFYLTVRTGLRGDGDGVMRDKLQLLGEIRSSGGAKKMVPHGSFSLDGGAVELGSGLGAGLELGTVEAQLIKWGRSRNNVGDGITGYTFKQWRMPVGSTLLVQEIDSSDLVRVVATAEGLKIVDANGYGEIFEELEAKRVQAAAASAAARHK